MGGCPDLELHIFQCRSVAVTHVMCWRGLRRKQRRQEGVILVCSPVRVRVRPHVKGWACLAQNTDCTSSTNLSTKTPLGGWRWNERTHILQCRRTLRGFKAALKFLGSGEGWLYVGEQEKEWRGGGRREEWISRFSSCKADLAEAKPSLPFLLPIRLCGGNPPRLQPALVLSHSVGKHKLQKRRRSS